MCSVTTACTRLPRQGVIELAARRSGVGWAKRSVPTIRTNGFGEMVGTAQARLCPPYDAGQTTPPSPAPCCRTRPAIRQPQCRGAGSGAATNAISVRSIGAKPSFAVSTRWSAWIAISDRMLSPMPAATAATMPRGWKTYRPCASSARRFPAHGRACPVETAGRKADQRYGARARIARMAFAGDPVHALRPHRDAALFPRGALEQCEIKFAAFEFPLEVGALVGADVEPQTGMRARESRQQFCQTIGGEILRHTEPHRALALGASHHVARFLGQRQQPPRIGQQRLAGFRRRHILAVAVQ